MAFKMMENIGNFLDSAYAYGVPKLDMFQTVDLYEGANMPQVINGIHALGRKVSIEESSGSTRLTLNISNIWKMSAAFRRV